MAVDAPAPAPVPVSIEPDDSIQARISSDCPDVTRLLLQTAWARDLSGIKPLLDEPGRASIQDPTTKETPLHAAIRGCGRAPTTTPITDTKATSAKATTTTRDDAQDTTATTTTADGNDDDDDDDDDEEDDATAEDRLKVEEAIEVVRELLCWGAIWNDVDANNETPGCVALRLGRKELYELCVNAGVRAELLFGLMGGYEELESGDDEGDAEMLESWGEDEEGEENKDEENKDEENKDEEDGEEAPQLKDVGENKDEPEASDPTEVTSERYLQSGLTLSSNKLLDADLNGVMMSWETPIMQRTVAALLPGTPPPPGKRILNIGFGMGIVDGLFAATAPACHHIVEAHPDVLARLATSSGVESFGKDWEASGPTEGAFKIHAGKWQDVVPALVAAGEVYDVVYFDTFGEDYGQLRNFFTEQLPGILDTGGVFGYFNGCGADRTICYDVYTRVAEAHLAEAGMDVEWIDVDVDVDAMGNEGEGEWEGVKRRYWTLEKYRLPVCTWMG